MPSLRTLKKACLWLLKFLGLGVVYVVSDLKIRVKGPEYKIGLMLTADGQRVDNVTASVDELTGKANGHGIVWAVLCWSPHMVEKIAHNIFAALKTDKYRGSSGGSEWFSGYNMSAVFFILFLGWEMDATLPMTAATAAVGALFPWPIDAAFVVTAIATLQLLTVFAFVWAVWSLFSHLIF